MFDTVILKANGIDINPNYINNAETVTFINKDGEYISKIKFSIERVKFEYLLQRKILQIELSIPKFIYGTNTKMINESDILNFWIQLHKLIRENLGTTINKEQWIVKRLDVSYNFKVDNVGMWIAEISKQNISKRTQITYNRNETVIFKNKSSSICFYDKEKECIYRKEPKEVIEQAKGILRLEIRPATYHLREYLRDRKAVDLLTKAFFTYIIEKFKINEVLKLQSEPEDSELFKVLNVMKVADIEKVIGFTLLVEKIGEKQLLEKCYYKEGTFRNRKELIEEYNKNINQKNTKQEQFYIPLD